MPSKIQKLYTINLLAAFVVCVIILIYLILYVFSFIQVDTKFSLLSTLIILVFFLPINLFVWIQNTNYKLKIPGFVSRKYLKVLLIMAFIVFVTVFVSSSIAFPYLPITAYGNTYVDKNGGTNYTYAQFRNYQKWELAFITTGNILVLQGMVLFPFFDIKSRTWRFKRQK
jgi:hypothetical protein